jgi:hypothetical protein
VSVHREAGWRTAGHGSAPRWCAAITQSRDRVAWKAGDERTSTPHEGCLWHRGVPAKAAVAGAPFPLLMTSAICRVVWSEAGRRELGPATGVSTVLRPNPTMD